MKNKITLNKILTGNLISEYPVDESQIVSNAGNAELYSVETGGTVEISEVIT
jgi:hypothetical protein